MTVVSKVESDRAELDSPNLVFSQARAGFASKSVVGFDLQIELKLVRFTTVRKSF